MTNPYQVLGVSQNASNEDVKRAYRELSRKYHPDTYADNPLSGLAEEKFKEVQEAYQQIMDTRSGQGNFGYGSGQTGYGQQGGYQNPYGQEPQYSYSRRQYQNYGGGYGRDPYNNYGGGCGTGNMCCDLWCADTLCECMGGDLCGCF